MQYGNHSEDIENANEKRSLNRTMQYGNYFFSTHLYIPSVRFKSYYVVWKLSSCNTRSYIRCSLNRTMQYGNYVDKVFPTPPMFCLNRTMQYGNTTEATERIYENLKFKSYYVVWKLHCFLLHLHLHLRLNRTMQYGNATVFFSIVQPLMFKSYYVVWKLAIFSAILLLAAGLNRTMQYGNHFLPRLLSPR